MLELNIFRAAGLPTFTCFCTFNCREGISCQIVLMSGAGNDHFANCDVDKPECNDIIYKVESAWCLYYDGSSISVVNF